MNIVVFPKFDDFLVAFFERCLAREPRIGLLLFVKMVAIKLQIFNKSAENQHFMVCPFHFVPFSNGIVELRTFAFVIGQNELRMNRQLAQFCNGLNDDILIFKRRFTRRFAAQKQIPNGRFFFFVHLFLLRIHVRIHDLSDYFRQIFGHFLFRSSQKIRFNEVAETLFLPFILPLFNRFDKIFVKNRKRTQQTGVDKFHLRPKVGERIFNRRTTERNFMRPVQAINGFKRVAAFVFDVLAFIQNNVFPIHFLQ